MLFRSLHWHGVNAAYLNAGEISIDPWTGALLQNASAEIQTRGQRVMDMQLWMHNGAVWGWTGRILVFLSGISLTTLSTSRGCCSGGANVASGGAAPHRRGATRSRVALACRHSDRSRSSLSAMRGRCPASAVAVPA